MPNLWRQVFKIKIGDRVVIGEIHQDGGFRVKTTTLKDEEGSAGWETESDFVAIIPKIAGSPIEYEAESLEELQQDLLKEGDFTEDEINTIIQEFLKGQ